MDTAINRRTRIKVCGFTCPDQAAAATDLGIDAIGLMFYRPSPRAIDFHQAEAICRALPPFVSVVALFLDAAVEEVEEALRSLPVTLLQFHGTETPDYCSRFSRPYIRSVPRDRHSSAEAFQREFADASGFLYDSNVTGQAGGLGETFDWSSVQQTDDRPRILAGGLSPENVAAGMRAFNPQSVDVSSGVERQHGDKDIGRIAHFIAAVSHADMARQQGIQS